MASTVGKVRAVFTASTSGLVSGMAQAGAASKGLAGSMGSLRGAMRGMDSGASSLQARLKGLHGSMRSLVAIQGAQLFGSIASSAASAVRSLVGMGSSAAETADDISKMSRRVGMSYGELAGLKHAADLAGIGLEQLVKGSTKSDIAMVKAQNGNKVAIASFAALGLSVNELAGMSAAERFTAISDAIAALPSAAQRAAAAVSIFGKAGAELLPLFEIGAGGVKAATEDAKKFGLALTNAQGVDIENMNDGFKRASAAIQGVITQVVANLSPAIKGVVDQFTNLIGDTGGAKIGSMIGTKIMEGALAFARVADTFIAQSGGLFKYFSSVGAQWNAVWDFAKRTGSLFMAVGASIKVVFATAILLVTGAAERLLRTAIGIAKSSGLPTKGLRDLLVPLDAFNNSISQSLKDGTRAAAQGFSDAFGSSAPKAGEAIAGPLETVLKNGMAQSAQSAATPDKPAAIAPPPPPVKVEVKATLGREAVQGIDSRSTAGATEMFRLMRENPSLEVQDKIAEHTREIALNTRDAPIEIDSVDFAGAAGS